jgi:uncharacterized membrane-anchored protein YitT (DUF2179 family)
VSAVAAAEHPETHRHHPVEDVLAIGLGTLLVSIGLALYTQATLLTGSAAGIALLLHYASGLGFYVVAVWRLGWMPAIRTFAAVLLVSFLVRLEGGWIRFEHLSPLFAAVAGGAVIGVGLLILFRHRTGLGGINLVALFLQERFGWRAGYVQLAIDAVIMAAAFLVIPADRVLLSVAGAAVMNIILAINHRPGRYAAVSL